MCWLMNGLAQLQDEGFGNICVPREEIPTPGVMAVRDLLCAGSLVGFLLCLLPGNPKFPKSDIFELFCCKVIRKLKLDNPEWSFPVLFLHPNVPRNSQV